MWVEHPGELPIITASAADVDRWWRSCLRRFDLEHTVRLFEQPLRWTAPKFRDPAAADRWTRPIVAAYIQLCLARPIAVALRALGEARRAGSTDPGAGPSRGSRHLRLTTSRPAGAPEPGRPGSPPGSRDRHRPHITTWATDHRPSWEQHRGRLKIKLK